LLDTIKADELHQTDITKAEGQKDVQGNHPLENAKINPVADNQDDSHSSNIESLKTRFNNGEWLNTSDICLVFNFLNPLKPTTPNSLDKRVNRGKLADIGLESQKIGRVRQYRKLSD
jgi:hypothetical protein